MANMLFANNANTTLASSLTNSATSMSVTSASAFPSPTGSQYFYCTLADAATQQTIEIVKVTAVSGTTFTIVRGQDGTSGTAFNSGDVVSLRLVAASLNDFPKLDEANTFTQTQTFSNPVITNYQDFTSSSAPSYSQGRVWFDSTQHTLAQYNDVTNNIVHLGEEVQLKVINNTGSSIPNGSPVYITGTSSGQTYPNIALAKADTITTSNVIGLTNGAIANGAAGYVTTIGLLTPANTGTFTVGDVLYLSPYSAGQIMNTIPPTGYPVRLGIVAYSNNPNGSIYITKTNVYSLASNIVGTVAVANGGTGLTSLTAGYIPYGNGTGAFSSNSSFIFNGTNFAVGLTAPYNATTDIGSFSKSYAGVSQVVIDNQTSTGTAGLSFSAYGGGWNVQVPGSTSFINPLIFKFNSTETVRMFASGGVSIGNTTDPGATNLSVTGFTSSASFRPTSATVPTNGVFLPTTNAVGFATNSTEAARFDGSQNLLVGTTTSPAGSGNVRTKNGFVQDYRAIYSGSKTLSASTATNFATVTNPTGSTNVCLKIRVNAWVLTNSGGDAFCGESSEWIVNYNTYGGVAQTPTVTRLNNQAWQATTYIASSYAITATNSSGTMTLTATQTPSGAGSGAVINAAFFYSVENVYNTAFGSVFTAL